jgi:formylglycine-generating enzyme required for sulfatase activity
MDDEWVVIDGYENHPVTQVNWYGARAYCDWAERRLPTEAEWEHAARGDGGSRSLYPWGESTPTCQLANFNECLGGTREVGIGSNGVGPYGLQDMTGNVWEWVADWYQSDYYSVSLLENPTGPSSGTNRVLRGGSWHSSIPFLHTSFRHSLDPLATNFNHGFRCADAIELSDYAPTPSTSSTE